jgi:5,5'-dehydrodivanillate O-demethylase oxygenase subunit
MRQAENELLTQIGPGTPAGALMRRYWHPVSVAGELTEEQPTKRVRILGEDMVVFRLPLAPGETQVRYGLVAEQCQHRKASLFFGKVDCEGIRCPYHGWKYDLQGNCLETPPEPPDWAYKNEIHQTAYPVQKLAGLLFAYMGPAPAPELPRWDVLVREDGKRWITIESLLECNWLQPMENSVDPSHLYWLHGDTAQIGEGLGQYNEKHEFMPFEYGIYKRRIYPGKTPADPPIVDEHPLIFPTILRHVTPAPGGRKNGYRHAMQMRVPVDDTHTQVFRINFIPSATERSPVDQDAPYEYRANKDENGEYRLHIVGAQDAMAWETQGPIVDRTKEHLGHADLGIVMLRRLLKEQIEIVQQGGEPMGVIRDPAKNKMIHISVMNEMIGLSRTEAPSEDLQAVAS